MSSLWQFLNSQLFVAIVTLLVGFVAWLVYKKQRSDQKRDIANSILSEIQSAERAVERVRNYIRDTSKADDINIRIIELNSWTHYKYYFSSDFDEDEWKEINDFYSNALLLDSVLQQGNAVFESNAEQIRANMQRVLADLTEYAVAQTVSDDNLEQNLKSWKDRTAMFDQLYQEKMKDFTFTPAKYVNDAQRILEDLRPISTSTAGEKIKKLAGKRKK